MDEKIIPGSLESIESVIRAANKTISNVSYCKKIAVIDLANITFKNVTFENLHLNGTINGCEFINCHFISCSFADISVVGNRFAYCYMEDMSFRNNSFIEKNSFESVVGGIEQCNIISFDDNSFFDMDFSGFLPCYRQAREGYKVSNPSNQKYEIRWCRNHFRGVTLPIDKIIKLCEETNYIAAEKHLGGMNLAFSMYCSSDMVPIGDIDDISTSFSVNIREWKEEPSEGRVIKHVCHEKPAVYIDMSNMEKKKKVWLVASMFMKYPIADSYIVFVDGKWSIPESGQRIYTTDLPNPITIVDRRGYPIDTCKIPTVDWPFPFDVTKFNSYPGEKIKISVPEVPIDDPNNFPEKRLVIRNKCL